jgi:hypothetical protein
LGIGFDSLALSTYVAFLGLGTDLKSLSTTLTMSAN